MKKVRCAIYTRKSSENGLEQEFNSLDAQREACAAYIASQKHEGWVLLDERYDDGGISGGTLERRGLQRLFQDIDAGRIDQIIVYKIDRLTRSLMDFAKLVERLDKANASFVSVTQSFNTATSMGRLTLNMLLSFAQFEREVTSERIRDKMAASKKKGMWMGGQCPLGYAPDGRTLKINTEEAKTVTALFELYSKLGSLIKVTDEAQKIGFRTRAKVNPSESGKYVGGQHLSRSNIHYILTNPIYAGKIRHRSDTYDGLHPAIIDPTLWEKVQQRLMSGAKRQRGRPNVKSPCSKLIGRLFDETGDRLTPSHSMKGSRRYRYYISNRLLRKKSDRANANPGWRLPAKPLEDKISQAILCHLRSNSRKSISDVCNTENAEAYKSALDGLDVAADADAIIGCLSRATIAPGQLRVELNMDGLAELIGTEMCHLPAGHTEQQWDSRFLTFETQFQHRKRGVETKLIFGESQSKTDPAFIQDVALAHHYFEQVKSGKNFDEVASSCNISKRRLMQIIELAFLSPEIVKTILKGQQPSQLTSRYIQRNQFPANWQKQEHKMQELQQLCDTQNQIL